MKILAVVLAVMLVATLAAPAAADHRDREDSPRTRATTRAYQPGELQSQDWLAWLLFAVIFYHVFFVPAPPLVLKCIPYNGVVICYPG